MTEHAHQRHHLPRFHLPGHPGIHHSSDYEPVDGLRSAIREIPRSARLGIGALAIAVAGAVGVYSLNQQSNNPDVSLPSRVTLGTIPDPIANMVHLDAEGNIIPITQDELEELLRAGFDPTRAELADGGHYAQTKDGTPQTPVLDVLNPRNPNGHALGFVDPHSVIIPKANPNGSR